MLIRFDASAAKESACLLRLWNIVIKGYRSPGTTNDVHYGTCFHKFREELAKTKDTQASLLAAMTLFSSKEDVVVKPKKTFLDVNHLATTCLAYAANPVPDSFEYLLDKDNIPLVECKFAIPYCVDDKNEVLLQGTIDMIGKFKNGGAYAVGDIKATAIWNRVDYLASYRLSPQLMFYNYAICWMGRKFPESIFGEMSRKRIGFFIDGAFVNATKPTEFHRSEVFFFDDDQMAEFGELLDTTIHKLLACETEPLREGILNGACSTIYGPCKFSSACGAPDNVAREQILKTNFITKPYEPLRFS